MKEQITAILARVIPNAFSVVTEYKYKFSGKNEIKIIIAATNDEINRVRGQYPACVSLLLELETMQLQTQIFGGMGGIASFETRTRKSLKSVSWH
jgi:hypothetical protein